MLIPPLSERVEDIPLLAEHYLETYVAKHERKILAKPSVFELLKRYRWPGDVRELKHMIEYLVVVVNGGEINEDMKKVYLGIT